jgi:hypothetical protein
MSTSAARRLLALTVACMAVWATACGSSDEGADGNAQQQAPPKTDSVSSELPSDKSSTTGAGLDEDRVTAVVKGMYRDLAAADAAGVCSVMSGSARAQIAQNVPGGSTEPAAARTCEKSLAIFLKAAADSGTLQRTSEATVVNVTVHGTAARAMVSFGAASGAIRLVKENGDWRVGRGAVAPSR